MNGTEKTCSFLVTQDSLRSLGTVNIALNTEGGMILHEIHVVLERFNIDCDGLIGKDFLLKFKCKIDYAPVAS